MRVLIIAAAILFSSNAFTGGFITSRLLMPGERVVGPKCKKKFDQKFRKAAIEVLEKAIANGYKGYDGIKFEELIANIKSEVIHVGCWPKNIRINESGRTGAMYQTDMKSITLNYILQTEEVPYERLQQMAIHEHLGAFGYQDREGEITHAIYFMSLHVNDGSQLLPSDLLRPEQLASNEGGTSTGTGGGGDPHQLHLKGVFFSWFYESVHKKLVEGQITLHEGRRQLRRFLEIRVEYFVAQRKMEPPKYEVVEYFGYGFLRCDSYVRGGMGITVGVGYLNQSPQNLGTLSAYMEALASEKGKTVRCLGSAFGRDE